MFGPGEGNFECSDPFFHLLPGTSSYHHLLERRDNSEVVVNILTAVLRHIHVFQDDLLPKIFLMGQEEEPGSGTGR